MTTFRSIFISLLLLAAVPGWSASYDIATRRLTMPDVLIGATHYPSVIIRIDDMAITAVGSAGQGSAPDMGVYDPNAGTLSMGPTEVVSNFSGAGRVTFSSVTVKLNSFELLQLAGAIVVANYKACPSKPADVDAKRNALSDAYDGRTYTVDNARQLLGCDPSPVLTNPSLDPTDAPGSMLYVFPGYVTVDATAQGVITGLSW